MTKSYETQAIDVLNSLQDVNKPFHRVYYLLGSNNDYLKNQVINRLKEVLVPEQFSPFDFLTLSAMFIESFNEVEFAISSPPFGKTKLIIIKDAQDFSKRDFKRLTELKIPEFCVLVVTTESEKIPIPLFGDVVLVNKYDVSEEIVKNWIKSKFKKEGLEISIEATKELKDRLNGDFSLLDFEIKKVCLYVGNRSKVELPDIISVVENIPEQGIYELIDAIVSKNREEALMKYGKMVASANPIPENILLTELLKSLTQILLIKDMLEKGIKNNEEIAEHLRQIYSKNLNKYVVAKIIKNTENYTLKDIFVRFEALQEIDSKSKIGEIELPLALKLFVESL
jgi:DNA polymerase-3 subunit delta